MAGFIARRIADFKTWWHAPPTRKDRYLGAVVGVMGGFWIGLLVGAILFDGPAPFSTWVWWPVSGMVGGLACGVLFPKITTCICFPFSTIGGGTN